MEQLPQKYLKNSAFASEGHPSIPEIQHALADPERAPQFVIQYIERNAEFVASLLSIVGKGDKAE